MRSGSHGRRARENPFATDRLHGLELRLPGSSWSRLLERLERLGWRGAVVGPEGSGKTTLLENLAPRLGALGFRVRTVTLRRGDRKLPKADARWLRRAGGGDFLLLDGADELSGPAWWRIVRKSRRAGGVVIATHRAGRLPTLHRSTTSPELLAELVQDLLGEAAAALGPLQPLFDRHQGDLRACLRELYDLYAATPEELESSKEGAGKTSERKVATNKESGRPDPPTSGRRPRPPRLPVFSVQRRFHRYPVEGISGTLLPSTSVTLLNLSRSGLAVEVPEPLAVGESYLFRFQYYGRSTTLEMRVAWCRPLRGRWRILGGPGKTYLIGGSIVDLHRDSDDGLWDGLAPDPGGGGRSGPGERT